MGSIISKNVLSSINEPNEKTPLVRHHEDDSEKNIIKNGNDWIYICF